MGQGESIQVRIIRSRRRRGGFTLVELLVVVLIAAILMGIAVPAMESLVATNQLNAVTDDLASALNMARSEAGKLGLKVRLSATSGNQDWGASGWSMNVINADGSVGTQLRQGAAVSAYTVKSTNTSLSFDSTGRLYNAAGTGEFVICQGSGPPAGAARMITVALSGRVRVAPNDSSSGWPLDDATGAQITGCTP
jgi:type IV fimbrial biogenesis protein FimT